MENPIEDDILSQTFSEHTSIGDDIKYHQDISESRPFNIISSEKLYEYIPTPEEKRTIDKLINDKIPNSIIEAKRSNIISNLRKEILYAYNRIMKDCPKLKILEFSDFCTISLIHLKVDNPTKINKYIF